MLLKKVKLPRIPLTDNDDDESSRQSGFKLCDDGGKIFCIYIVYVCDIISLIISGDIISSPFQNSK